MSHRIPDSTPTVITRSMNARTRRSIARSHRVAPGDHNLFLEDTANPQSSLTQTAHVMPQPEFQVIVSDVPWLRVEGVLFTPKQAPGDFTCLMKQEWICNPPAVVPTEFPIFNDNLHNWTEAMLHPTQMQLPGGGNAAIRRYESNHLTKGIPTGAYGEGFKSLEQMHFIDARLASLMQLPCATASTRQIIDAASERIAEVLVARRTVETVYYSADPYTHIDIGEMGFHPLGLPSCPVPLLGTGIFSVADDVITYITLKLTVDLPLRVNEMRQV